MDSGGPTPTPAFAPVSGPAHRGGWRIEPARPQDRPALEDLFAACTAETVRLRFFGRLRALPQPYLDGLLGGPPEVHDGLVGYAGSRTVLAGMASLIADPGAGAAELGLLVGDAHQGQGLGRALMGVLLERARARGATRVSASVLPHRAALLRALGRRPELEFAGGGVTREARTCVYKLL